MRWICWNSPCRAEAADSWNQDHTLSESLATTKRQARLWASPPLPTCNLFSITNGCESWTINKAERPRIDVFWTVVLEKTLESSLDSKEIKPVSSKGNQSWIFLGRTECQLQLTLQYYGHLMQRTNSLEKNLKLGKIYSKRRREQQRMKWLDGITNSMNMSWASSRSWWWTGRPGCYSPWGHKELDMTEGHS